MGVLVLEELPKKRLGEILVGLGFCSGSAMQDVLRKQAKMREKKGYALRIGLMMLQEGVITERQLAIGLASQFGTAAVDLVNVELEVGILHDIPPALFEKYSFVPVHQDEDGLRVATDDLPPSDLLEQLKKAVNADAHYVIAPATQLAKVRAFCKQHMRRIMAGQLPRTKLPEKFFTEDDDPESTIKPGAISLASLQAPAPAEPDPLAALGGAPAAAPAGDLAAQFAAARAAKGAGLGAPAAPAAPANVEASLSGVVAAAALAAENDAFGDPLDQVAKVKSDPGAARGVSMPGQVRKVGSVSIESKTLSYPGAVHPAAAPAGDAFDAFGPITAEAMDPLDAMNMPSTKTPPPPPPKPASPASAKDMMEALKRSAQQKTKSDPGAVQNPEMSINRRPASSPGAAVARPAAPPPPSPEPADAFGSVDAFGGGEDALSGFGGVDELLDPLAAFGGGEPARRPGTGPLDGRVTPGEQPRWGTNAGLAAPADDVRPRAAGDVATVPGAVTSPFVEVNSARMDRVPPLSRLLVATPASIETLLGELKTASIESLTLAPHAHGADVLSADEHGSRVTGGLSRAEYEAVLGRCRELLKLAGPPKVPVQKLVELPVGGEAFSFRLTALPSEPPTLSFAAADREGWAARRQVQQETALIDGLAKRARSRRGLVIVTGAGAAPVSETVAGMISALRRESLRIATFAASPGPRVREVTTMPVSPERSGEMLDPDTLLAVAETGVDLLAFDLPLTPDQQKLVVPLGNAEACVLMSSKQRDTVDAVLSLVAAKVPTEQLAATLELVIAVHRADRLCPSCRRPVVLTDDKLPAPLKGSKLAGTTAFESPGCPLCKKTGVRGTVSLYEVLTWERDKLPLDTFALDKKSLLKRLFELRLVRPLSLEAQKALTNGTISLIGYLRLLGLAK